MTDDTSTGKRTGEPFEFGGREYVRVEGTAMEVTITQPDGPPVVVVVPTDDMPEATADDAIRIAEQHFHDTQALRDDLDAELVATTIAEYEQGGVFKAMVDMAADAIGLGLTFTVDDADRNGMTDAQLEAFIAKVNGIARETAIAAMNEAFLTGPDAAAFKENFVRDLMAQAWAWAVADARIAAAAIEAETGVAVEPGDDFRELVEAVFAEGGYVIRAMLTMTSATVEQMANHIGQMMSDIPDLADLLAEKAKAALVDALADRAKAALAVPQTLPKTPKTPAFSNGKALVPNDLITRGFLVAAMDAADGRGWLTQPDGRPYYNHRGDGWDVNYTITPEAAESAAAAWAEVKQLDDAHAIVAMAALAYWLANHHHDPVLQTATITPADLLALQGTPKHHKGGYRREDKLAVCRRMTMLGNVFVQGRGFKVTELDEKGRRQRLTATPEGLFIVISSRVPVEQQDMFSPPLYASFKYRPGDWAESFMLDGRGSKQLALMMQTVLTFDPRTARYPLRLGMYLTWGFRVRAHTRTWKQPFYVGKLLAEAKLDANPDEKNPQRVRQVVEKALNELQAAGVIGDWGYPDDDGNLQPAMPGLPKRGWFPVWLAGKVVVMPPKPLTDAYLSIGERRTRALNPGRSTPARA